MGEVTRALFNGLTAHYIHMCISIHQLRLGLLPANVRMFPAISWLMSFARGGSAPAATGQAFVCLSVSPV